MEKNNNDSEKSSSSEKSKEEDEEEKTPLSTLKMEAKASLPSPNEKTPLSSLNEKTPLPIPSSKGEASPSSYPPTTSSRSNGPQLPLDEKQKWIMDLAQNPSEISRNRHHDQYSSRSTIETLCTEDAAAIPPSLQDRQGRLPVLPGVIRVGGSNDDDDDDYLTLQQSSGRRGLGSNGFSSSKTPLIEAELATDTGSKRALQEEVDRLNRLTQQLRAQQEQQQQRESTVVVAKAEIVKDDQGDKRHDEQQQQRPYLQKYHLYFYLMGCVLLAGAILGVGCGVGLEKKKEKDAAAASSPNLSPSTDGDGTIISQLGSNINGENAYDYFGESVAMSGDGARIVVGGILNDNNITGPDTGHVRVYEWIEDIDDWRQLGNDIYGQEEGALFGLSVDMTFDGNRIIVGAPGPEDGGSFGSVRVYEYNWKGENTTTTNNTVGYWQQVGTTLVGKTMGSAFGWSVAISSDGTRIAMGGYFHDGNNRPLAGLVQVYDWTSIEWNQVGVDIEGDQADDGFGFALAMNENGTRMAVNYGGYEEDPGHVKVLDWTGTQWIPVGSDLTGAQAGDGFGNSVAMSADGNRIAVGSDSSDENGVYAGHVQVFEWIDDEGNSEWQQVGNKINGKYAADQFGWSVAMTFDGNRIVVGIPYSDANGSDSGQVVVFDWTGDEWRQAGPDVNGETAVDECGYSVSISSDGSRMAASSPYHSASGAESGHVRVFEIESPA